MHRKTIVLGTGNSHKVSEILPLLSDPALNLDLRAATTYGPFDPVEDGATLEENAIIKARAAMALSNEWAIADDTGLFVEALNGRPGIFAARYAGLGCTFNDNIRKLLGELEAVPPSQRGATFTCVIALCRPDAEPVTFQGDCRGSIALRPRGEGGFGYDPVFIVSDLAKSFAELSPDEKNAISQPRRRRKKMP